METSSVEEYQVAIEELLQHWHEQRGPISAQKLLTVCFTLLMPHYRIVLETMDGEVLEARAYYLNEDGEGFFPLVRHSLSVKLREVQHIEFIRRTAKERRTKKRKVTQ